MDVLGLKVEEARRRLREAEVAVRETVTAPPRGGVEGAWRVVRVRSEANHVFVVSAAFQELSLDE